VHAHADGHRDGHRGCNRGEPHTCGDGFAHRQPHSDLLAGLLADLLAALLADLFAALLADLLADGEPHSDTARHALSER
jgi:hypothetical protein